MKIDVRMLDPIEEYELMISVYTTLSKDTKAREKLFKHYLPLAKSETTRAHAMVSKQKRISFDDLFSEACCGLLIAIDKFNPARCVRLAPVARMYIKDSLRVFLMNNSGVGIKISQSSNSRKIYFGVSAYCRENNIAPPFTHEQRQALMTKFKTTEDIIILFEDLRSAPAIIDDAVTQISSTDRNPEDQANINLIRQSLSRSVSPYFNDMENLMFREKFMNGDPITVEEFAKQHNLAPKKARAIAMRVMRVVRNFVTDDFRYGLVAA